MGSKAPLFTLPACTHTIVRSSTSGKASRRIRPCASTGTRTTLSRPNPTSESAFCTLACTSSPTTTVSGGAPNNPCASTSQPARANSACRAAASAEKFAAVAQVTNPPALCKGRWKISFSPPQRDVLERSIDGRSNHKTGVLIPRGGEPICGHRRRKRPAGHESKESSAGRCHGGRRADFIQFSEHRLRAGRMFWKGLIEVGKCGKRLLPRCDGASVERFQGSGLPASPRRPRDGS